MNFPRPDLSSLKSFQDLAGSLRAEGLPENMQARMTAMKDAQDKIKDLEGVATDDDEYIKATYNAADGFCGLTLDPRAMRMPSVDLAAEIVRVSRLAREDFEARRRETLTELGQQPPTLDLDEAQANVAEISEAYARGMSDLQGLVEQFRNKSGQ
ncbi:YbaB/EbfC family nucleoid-associated protein [Nocardioides jensenii]|uniref:YbaB/EbfC family nucleoid-associated protein n=1 Tax=Nocardioides jensenii TaxID=1843 RepID=UPI00082DD8DA|nr:YbaB/EbfC family nucleoid-associated protein [Nocardioides jensenii]